jgi:methionyl-tRNA formyltransferase
VAEPTPCDGRVRVVYLGSPADAVPPLHALVGAGHDVAFVITQPDRRRSRGAGADPSPVKRAAAELGIAVRTPEKAREVVEEVAASGADLGVVVAFGQLLPVSFLEALPHGFVNMHFSLLPRWRGAAPVERAIQAGDKFTGVTIMRLVEELDAGPMCAQERFVIREADNYGLIAPHLAAIGGRMLVSSLSLADAGGDDWTEQLDGHDEGEITYAEKILRDDRLLRPRASTAVELDRTIRALTPHIGAIFETAGGDPLRVEQARVTDRTLEPGTAAAEEGRLFVGTTDMTLELLRVRPAGGKTMDVESFLRGNDAPVLIG